MTPAEKPPYSVPSMAEIRAVPWNGHTVVSTFSGCGGSCLGFRMEGYRVLYASEFVPAAQETYIANAPDTHLDTRDIRTVTAEDILAITGLKRGELDVLEGSPPCASFSTAGKRDKGWGRVNIYSDTTQRSDDLFFEFVRLLEGLQPKVFVAENVSGLVKGVAKGYFKRILAAMRACGYTVSARLLDAQWLGVPQMRQRVIFVGVRNDLNIEPAHPTPLPYRYSVRDAIPWIDRAIHDTSGQWSMGDVTDQPAPTVMVTPFMYHQTTVSPAETVREVIMGVGNVGVSGFNAGKLRSPDEPAPTIMAHGAGGVNLHAQFGMMVRIEGATGFDGHAGTSVDEPAATVMAGRPLNVIIEPETDITRYSIGPRWDNLAMGESDAERFNLVRSHPDKPSQTILGGHGHGGVAGVTHPYEKRKFAIAELRRICAFPDDFILTGTYSQQWERLGRAVPPVMMAHVARVIRDDILAKVG